VVAVGIGACTLLSVGCWVQGAAQCEKANLNLDLLLVVGGLRCRLRPLSVVPGWLLSALGPVHGCHLTVMVGFQGAEL